MVGQKYFPSRPQTSFSEGRADTAQLDTTSHHAGSNQNQFYRGSGNRPNSSVLVPKSHVYKNDNSTVATNAYDKFNIVLAQLKANQNVGGNSAKSVAQSTDLQKKF